MITISSDKNELDIHFIHKFLTNSYWAKGRTIEDVETSIKNSFCYGIYKNGKQIGFARVICDAVVFAYIMDVFIVEAERGKGYAQNMMHFLLNDNSLSKVNQWYLKTKDAHKFYSKLGFNQLKNEEWFMVKISTT